MKNGVTIKVYYALLDWKDENMDEWLYRASHVYGVERLCDMSTEDLEHLAKSVLNEESEKQ